MTSVFSAFSLCTIWTMRNKNKKKIKGQELMLSTK